MMPSYVVTMVNADREIDSIEVESNNPHNAMLAAEEEYDRKGWHAEAVKELVR